MNTSTYNGKRIACAVVGLKQGLENVLISDAAQKALDRGGLVPRGGA